MHYVCSDIHGRWDKYETMMNTLDLKPEDRLFILGDVIDRGADGIRILEDLLWRENVIFLLGNHEIFLYCVFQNGVTEMIDEWLANGGRPTVEAFMQLEPERQDKILDFLEDAYAAIPDLKVGDNHFYLVHAKPDEEYLADPVLFCDMGPDETERLFDMVWNRIDDEIWEGRSNLEKICADGRKVIIGHTITTMFCRFNCDGEGHPRFHHDKYFIGIDCGCALDDARACLGVLRLEDMKEIYI